MKPDATQLEFLGGVADEPPSRVLRLGKDEMNLAEFPITLLTDRVPKGQTIIQYQDQIFDDKLGRPVTRKLTISAAEANGLPTAVDDDVILALIQLTKRTNGFTAREVQFNPPGFCGRLGMRGANPSMETQTTAAHFMDRVLNPLAASLNREAAQSILDLRIDLEIQARIAVLAERANEGELTPEEREEYLSYVEAADLLAIFKLKARRQLETNGTA